MEKMLVAEEKALKKLLKNWANDAEFDRHLIDDSQAHSAKLEAALADNDLTRVSLALRRLGKVFFEEGQVKVLKGEASGWEEIEKACVYQLLACNVIGTKTSSSAIELAFCALHKIFLDGENAEALVAAAMAALADPGRDEEQSIEASVPVNILRYLSTLYGWQSPQAQLSGVWQTLLASGAAADEADLSAMIDKCASYRLSHFDPDKHDDYEFMVVPLFPVELLAFCRFLQRPLVASHPLLQTPLAKVGDAQARYNLESDSTFARCLALAISKGVDVAWARG